jgi:hypothetical protein
MGIRASVESALITLSLRRAASRHRLNFDQQYYKEVLTHLSRKKGCTNSASHLQDGSRVRFANLWRIASPTRPCPASSQAGVFLEWRDWGHPLLKDPSHVKDGLWFFPESFRRWIGWSEKGKFSVSGSTVNLMRDHGRNASIAR